MTDVRSKQLHKPAAGASALGNVAKYAVLVPRRSPSDARTGHLDGRHCADADGSRSPNTPQVGLSAYGEVFDQIPTLAVRLEHHLVTALIAAGQMITAAMAGYVFARLEFRVKNPLFALVLATMMVPLQVTIVPVFLLIRGMGLADTLLALILPALPTAFGTFLMRQYFLGMPKDLGEAARSTARAPGGSSSRLPAPGDPRSRHRRHPGLQLPLERVLPAADPDHQRAELHAAAGPGLPPGQPRHRLVSVVLAGVVLSMIPAVLVFVFGQSPLREGITAGRKVSTPIPRSPRLHGRPATAGSTTRTGRRLAAVPPLLPAQPRRPRARERPLGPRQPRPRPLAPGPIALGRRPAARTRRAAGPAAWSTTTGPPPRSTPRWAPLVPIAAVWCSRRATAPPSVDAERASVLVHSDEPHDIDVRDPFVFVVRRPPLRRPGRGRRRRRRRASCSTRATTCTTGRYSATSRRRTTPSRPPSAPLDVWECPNLFELDGSWVSWPRRSPSAGKARHGEVFALVGGLEPEGDGWLPSRGREPMDSGASLYAPGARARRPAASLGLDTDLGAAREIAAAGWTGALTFPRELRLEGGVLRRNPRRARGLRRDRFDRSRYHSEHPSRSRATQPVFGSSSRATVRRNVVDIEGPAPRHPDPRGRQLVEVFADGATPDSRAYPGPRSRWRVEAAPDCDLASRPAGRLRRGRLGRRSCLLLRSRDLASTVAGVSFPPTRTVLVGDIRSRRRQAARVGVLGVMQFVLELKRPCEVGPGTHTLEIILVGDLCVANLDRPSVSAPGSRASTLASVSSSVRSPRSAGCRRAHPRPGLKTSPRVVRGER